MISLFLHSMYETNKVQRKKSIPRCQRTSKNNEGEIKKKYRNDDVLKLKHDSKPTVVYVAMKEI